MLRVAVIALLSVSPVASLASDDPCAPKGQDICGPTASFAHWVQANMAGVRNGKSEMVIQSASSASGEIRIEVVFDHTEDEWEKMVSAQSIDHSAFVGRYRDMIHKMACSPPVADMIANGATYRTVYRYKNGSILLDETVNECI